MQSPQTKDNKIKITFVITNIARGCISSVSRVVKTRGILVILSTQIKRVNFDIFLFNEMQFFETV